MLEEKVETKVASLLALVIADDVDPDCYDFVLSKLTTMAIRGTMPASCMPKESSAMHEPYQANAAMDGDSMEFEDFAERKESFIAP